MANRKSYDERVLDAMREHDLPRDLAERMVNKQLRAEKQRERVVSQPKFHDTNALLGTLNPMYT